MLTRSSKGIFGVLGAAGAMLAMQPASAQLTGALYLGVAGGGGYAQHNSPCPDIPCNTGDTCSCVQSSGKALFRRANGNTAYSGTYTLEVSADNSTGFNNGSGGQCFGTTGILNLTTKGGTIQLPFTAPGCRIGEAGHPNPLGISASIYIASGTGQYTNAAGSGSFSGSLNPATQQVFFTVVGYAQGLK